MRADASKEIQATSGTLMFSAVSMAHSEMAIPSGLMRRRNADLHLVFPVAISGWTHLDVAPLVEFDLVGQILQAGRRRLLPRSWRQTYRERAWRQVRSLRGVIFLHGFTLIPFACSERMPLTLAAAALSVVMIGMR